MFHPACDDSLIVYVVSADFLDPKLSIDSGLIVYCGCVRLKMSAFTQPVTECLQVKSALWYTI